MFKPVWLVKATPVVVQLPWLPSAVMVPLPETVTSVTASEFGFVTCKTTSPESPGKSGVLAVPAEAATVTGWSVPV